jgi:hypothetical protein
MATSCRSRRSASGPSGSFRMTVCPGKTSRVTRVRALSCNSISARAGESRPGTGPPAPIRHLRASRAYARPPARASTCRDDRWWPERRGCECSTQLCSRGPVFCATGHWRWTRAAHRSASRGRRSTLVRLHRHHLGLAFFAAAFAGARGRGRTLSDRDLGLDGRAGPRGRPNREPPAQGLDSVLEPEEAGPAGEHGGAAAVIAHGDA